MEDEDFLAAIEADNIDAPVEDQPEPEPAKVETPEPVQPAPVETALVEPPTPTEPPVPTEPKEVQHAPLAALLDERDKRKAAEKDLAELRKQHQPPPVQMPDVYEDPEGFARFQAQQSQELVLNTKLDISEEMARDKHGDDLVNAAQQWAQQRFASNPAFQAEVLGQRNPYAFVVQQYQREQIASQVSPDEFQQFQAWKQAQAGITQAAPAAPATPAPSIPPRSLAAAPAAGGILSDVVQDDAEIFDEVMSKG